MRVSVIIPYNKDRGFLEQAIKSVFTQTHKDIQLIVEQSDYNVSTNLNRGIDKATGDLICYLCEDDILPLDAIENTVKAWGAFHFCHANALYFGTGKLNWIPRFKNPTLKQMISRNEISGGTVTYSARCFENNRFDESLWTGEEYDFNMMLMKKGFVLGYIPILRYLYRLHKAQKSIGNRNAQYQKKRQVEMNKIRNRYL